MEEKKKTHGGARAGAGRPKGDSRLFTFRCPGDLADRLDEQENKTEFIRRSLSKAVKEQDGALASLGEMTSAAAVRPMHLPLYDQRVVAGFPVPLDNDERSQDIDMLRLLCPHPESSYLIRVQGESMIDAGIESGDIVIVDKSRRDPSEKEIAVCELNGEYTLKRVAVDRDGTRWLVPANPDYPRFPISDGDSFCVWGIVTYIIHRARD